MNTRTGWIALAAVLALSGCASLAETPTVGTAEQPPESGGAIELAVSELCEAGSSNDCIEFAGIHVLLPPTFERAEVESIEVTDSGNGATEVLGVTLTDDGSAVVASLSETAAAVSAHLVVRAGEEIIAAVTVAEPLTNNYVGIFLSPELGLDADQVVELIQGG